MAITKITDAEFKDTLENNDKIAIKFYADWCGSCKLIAPKYRKLSDKEDYSDITFLDVNAEENPEMRKWAGVNNLPFFATVEKGELKKGDFTSKIDNVVSMIDELK